MFDVEFSLYIEYMKLIYLQYPFHVDVTVFRTQNYIFIPCLISRKF